MTVQIEEPTTTIPYLWEIAIIGVTIGMLLGFWFTGAFA